MKKLIFNYYTDSGHGWFAVKRTLLSEHGVLQAISHYSYQRGNTVYLEEDCDCSVLFKALDTKGIEWGFIEKYTDGRHPIRSYESFKA